VLRREREITTTLNETAQARQLANTFQAAVQPYMARIQSMGANPVQAVESLLRADHLLSTSNKSQRAQLMAKLISDYDVDIMALDSALAGKPQADPVESRVEQLLQQRLAPFQQYLTHQQMMEQQRQEQVQANSASEVERMSQDPKYPHFNAVRADMADILAIQSNKGVYLSLEDAYNRAIAMNPEVAKAVAAQNSTQQQRENVAKANAQAQRALNASKSVGGAPAGGHTGSVNGNDRRATIAAAFDELASR
jgi:tetratricopeptide (TPR) repeat protein